MSDVLHPSRCGRARFTLIAMVALASALIAGNAQAHLSIIRQGAESRGAKETGDEHGRALAVGDFNGDGYEDLAVGAPKEDVGSTVDAGMVVINYGSPFGLTHVVAAFHTAETMGLTLRTGALLGSAIVAADFNHDGYDDLVIGAPGEPVGFAADAGRVYVLQGGPSGLSFRTSFTQANAGGVSEANDRFGAALAAGNWNGDSVPCMDLAIGTPGEDNGAGAVYTFHGSTALFLTADDFFVAADFSQLAIPGANIGATLAAGNFVSSTHDDLAIGAPFHDISSTNNAGAVYLLRGTSGGLALNGYPRYDAGDIDAISAGGLFGFSLAGGNLDNSAYDALAIGEPGHSHPGYEWTGRVHVLSGGSTGLDLIDPLDLRHCEVIGSCGSGDAFGSSVAVGNFESTVGYDDLAIGAHGYGSQFAIYNAGAVYVLYGGPNGPNGQYGWAGLSQANLGEQFESGDLFGDRVAFGRFDDSGKGALVASAPGEDIDASLTNVGLVHIIAPWRQALGLSCGYSIVMDCEDNIVFSQKPFDRVSVASTTKTLTVLIAAERSQLPVDDPMYVSLSQPYIVPAWVADDIPGSQVPLVENETMTLRELMWTCMFMSGNDAAYAIADLLGGEFGPGYSSFLLSMNNRATALNMDDTHFNNPAGLDSPARPYSGGHYSTPYDMALLSRAAMENEIVAEIVGSTTFEMNRRFAVGHDCEIEEWEFINIFSGVLNNPIQAANGIKGGETPNAKRTGLFSASGPGQGDAIAATFFTDPSVGWGPYIDDAGHLLELGADRCDFQFSYLGWAAEAAWFNEFNLDPGCRAGGSCQTFPGGTGGFVIRSYRTGGSDPLDLEYGVTDLVEVSIPYLESTELGAGPFRAHNGIRILNQGASLAIIRVTPSVGGSAQIHNIPAGGSVTLAPFTAGFNLSDFDLVIENMHTSQANADLTVETTYRFDLALGAGNPPDPIHSLTLKRPATVVSGNAQFAFTPDGPSPGTRMYVTVGDANTSVDAPDIEVMAPDAAITHGAAPNPFVASTRITFDLPRASNVGAEIFDAQGRRVRELEDRALEAGRWALDWDGRDGNGAAAPTGVYFYRLQVEGREAVSGKLVRTN